MLRAFRFALIAAIALAGIWYIASLPGEIRIIFGDTEIKAATPIAIFLLVLADGLFLLLIGLLRFLWRIPGRIAANRAAARRAAGEQAAVRALSALAAGDVKAAAAHAKIAQRRMPDEPLSLYVAGEAARQAGEHAAADAHFAALSKHKTAGFLGSRGLVSHHVQQSDPQSQALAAAHLRQAAASHPNSAWLRGQRISLAANQGDYAEAARLATDPAARAALAIMASRHAGQPRLAIDWARDAVRAKRDSAPAWLQLAHAHQRAGWPRIWHRSRAQAALRNGWKAAPHPDIATEFLKDISAPLDRARAAQGLAALNPNSPESAKLLAETALAAKLEGEAQRHAAAASGAGTAWICSSCHAEAPEWRHDCPRCGAVGTLAWSPTSSASGAITAPAIPAALPSLGAKSEAPA